MVTVDIFVPTLDKTYDFKLDENAYIRVLAEEMIEMIGQKEQSETEGEIGDIVLAKADTRMILPRNITLKEAGIHTGDKLIFV